MPYIPYLRGHEEMFSCVSPGPLSTLDRPVIQASHYRASMTGLCGLRGYRRAYPTLPSNCESRMNRYLVVMTACVDPSKGEYRLNRADPTVRLEDYRTALRFWL